MRLLIRSFILLVVVILIILTLWGGLILEKVGSHFLDTSININRFKFIPYKVRFYLYGINLAEKDIIIPVGTISFIPPKIEFYGLRFANNIILSEKKFSAYISLHRNWEVDIFFKDIDLNKLDYRFKNGIASGHINGIYTNRNCEFHGMLKMDKLVYSDSETVFLSISSKELDELIKTHNGTLELDFTYKGPVDEINELHRYMPGRKTIGLVRDLLLNKISSK